MYASRKPPYKIHEDLRGGDGDQENFQYISVYDIFSSRGYVGSDGSLQYCTVVLLYPPLQYSTVHKYIIQYAYVLNSFLELHPPHRKSSCILYGDLRDAYILHDSGVPPTTRKWKNPAKIGARNSGFASFDLKVGVRLRARCSQPDAKARSRGRNTRITLGDFRGVFSCSGWVSYRPHRKRDELIPYCTQCPGTVLILL